MKCPKCESENTQRLEVAFNNGTQNISTTSNTAGVGFSGGRIGVAGGVTTTSGQSQSVLAAACAPPAAKSDKGPSAALVLGLFFPCLPMVFTVMFGGSLSLGLLGMTLGSLVVFSPVWGAGLYLLRSRSKYNKQVWPPLYRHWCESWICHKCGGIYHQA